MKRKKLGMEEKMIGSKSGRFLVLAAVGCLFVAAVSSCAMNKSLEKPLQQSIRVDGDLQPKQVKITEFGNHQENGVSAFSTNYRQFFREIRKGVKTEEVCYWEPINWRGVNELPPNTKKIKISLVIENPRFKTYRLTKSIDIDGKKQEEGLRFSSGKKESFADIQEMYDLECPLVVGKTVRVVVRLDLLEGVGLPGLSSLPVSELSYRIGHRDDLSLDGKVSRKKDKGG
jgi:hypothetical protein